MSDPVDEVPIARLLAVAYRQLIDGLHRRLAERGWDDVRPAYGFVLLALRDADAKVTDLAALLGVSKQATSKLIGQMVEGRYVTRVAPASDARQRTIALAPRGRELLAAVEGIYGELEGEWANLVGTQAVARLHKTLTEVVLATHGGAFPTVRPTG
jgi:DNA-binding MarR family transcriptional regulator